MNFKNSIPSDAASPNYGKNNFFQEAKPTYIKSTK